MNNVLTKGFSGKPDMAFCRVYNQAIFSKRILSTSSPTMPQSPVRNKFAEASLFASASIDNPQASLEYTLMAELQGLKSAYIAAVIDYLTMPEIGSVFIAAYKGQVCDIINIKPRMAYKVIDMNVSILNANGGVVESGKAVSHELKWWYVATAVNASVTGSKLVIAARDRQGKEATFEQFL